MSQAHMTKRSYYRQPWTLNHETLQLLVRQSLAQAGEAAPRFQQAPMSMHLQESQEQLQRPNNIQSPD